MAIPLAPIIASIPAIIKLFDKNERKQGVQELTGNVLAEASRMLGVEFKDDKDLITYLNSKPDEVVKLKQLEADTELKMAEIEKEILKTVNQTMQSESKSEHWLQYAWRPFIGMNFGCYVGSLWLLPLIGKAPATLDQNIILAITAILGVASYYRGQEKVKKVEGK